MNKSKFDCYEDGSILMSSSTITDLLEFSDIKFSNLPSFSSLGCTRGDP